MNEQAQFRFNLQPIRPDAQAARQPDAAAPATPEPPPAPPRDGDEYRSRVRAALRGWAQSQR